MSEASIAILCFTAFVISSQWWLAYVGVREFIRFMSALEAEIDPTEFPQQRFEEWKLAVEAQDKRPPTIAESARWGFEQ